MSVIAIAAGGTAGHINPALALADELADRGHEVRFYGTPQGLEARLVPEHGYPFEALAATGFDRSRPWTLVSAGVRVLRSRDRLVREFRAQGAPAAAVGFGAYVEFPLGLAAVKLGVPLVLHEQNSVAGLANRRLAAHAACVALATPDARAAFEGHLGAGTRLIVTGNPVRRSILAPTREQGRDALGVPRDARLLLVFGGSKGATHLNEAVVALKDDLLARPDLVVVHGTGEHDFEHIREELALTPEQRRRWRLSPYIDDMGSALAAADLVLSRAGASSIAEIAARCVPSLLVPYPFATENHQAVNARHLVDAGGAVLLDDAQLDDPAFPRELFGLLDAPARLAGMRASLAGLESSAAAARLADAVEVAAREAAS